MKNSCKSMEVYDFKEEDELIETPAKRILSKFYNQSTFRDHVFGGTENLSEEVIATVIHGGADAANIDYSHNAAGSYTPLETKDFAHEQPSKLNHVLHNTFRSHEQAAEIKSNILESGSVCCGVECCSTPGATACLEGHSNCVFPDFPFNDDSARLAMNADESMSERSSSTNIADNTSSDGALSDNYFSGLDLDDITVGIVFHPDYVDYCGEHYLDSAVSFSSSCVEVKSTTIYEDERDLHSHLPIEDIIKIESEWSPRWESGTINISFISGHATSKDIVLDASGIQELRFPVSDSNWYKKQEAIEALDGRYKALWTVLIDSGMEKCSALHEGKALMLPRSYFPNFDTPFEEVIYPKGDPDAVSISKRDVDLLRPDTFVNDTIIDFYIKYLKTRLNVEERIKYHFFNSFFFRKLADMDKDPSSAFDGKAAFLRVRKWTRKVNLLEKDFIFIPVNYNYHWSLIVICYFGEAANYKDGEGNKSLRVPCILHMDSIKGCHAGLKDLMQSYLWEEWKERQKETREDLYSKFRNLKFVSLEIPQQQNSYDCGLFLLHNVERFLEEVPADLNISKLTSSSNFLQADWFPPGEASMKRAHIERLIDDLLNTHSEECSPSGGTDVHSSPKSRQTTQAYENGFEVSEKSRPFRDCRGSSQGIEMTLLAASSVKSNPCPGSTGLVLKELFESGSAPEPFDDAGWGDFQCTGSVDEFKRPISTIEEEVEASDSFLQTELVKPAFNHLDGIAPQAIAFPCSTGEFTELPNFGEVKDANRSPITPGCDADELSEVEADAKGQSIEAGDMNHAAESGGLVDQSGPKNSSEFYGHASSSDKLDIPVGESPYQMINSFDQAHPNPPATENLPMSSPDQGNVQVKIVGGRSRSESDEEEHASKRMRVAPPENS